MADAVEVLESLQIGRVAMKITGHKTRAVFDRSHIVSPVDLQEAARRISELTQPAVTCSGTSAVSES